MCTAHPYIHACGHNSVQWNYCSRSVLNFDTGVTTPCNRQHSVRPMGTEDDCPISICRWYDKGGAWTCCQCGNRPNCKGWCVFARPRREWNALEGVWEDVSLCNHTCCDECAAADGDGQTGKASAHAGGSKSRRGGGGASSSSTTSSLKKHKSRR